MTPLAGDVVADPLFPIAGEIPVRRREPDTDVLEAFEMPAEPWGEPARALQEVVA